MSLLREESIRYVLEASDGAWGTNLSQKVGDSVLASEERALRPRVRVLTAADVAPIQPTEQTWTVVQTTEQSGKRCIRYIRAGSSTERPKDYAPDFWGRIRPWNVLTTVTAFSEKERSEKLIKTGFIAQHCHEYRRQIARAVNVPLQLVHRVYRGHPVAEAERTRIIAAAQTIGCVLPPALRKR